MDEVKIEKVVAGQDINAVLIHPFSKLQISKTAAQIKLWNVPQRNANFTGREKLLSDIKERLQTLPGAGNKPVVITACHGLGGVGKTQLALEYVYRNDESYKLVCWIPADNAAIIEANFIELAKAFSLVSPDVAIDQVIHIIKEYLCKNRCLLIFDNAPDYKSIKKYIPAIGVEVLITSRYTEWLDKGIEVNVFTPEEAIEYIEKIVGRRDIDSVEAVRSLATTMGRLPLALAQAAAYIRQNKMRIEEYVELFLIKKQELLSKETLPIGDKHETVLVTWNITMEIIQKQSSLAPAILAVCSYLHCDNIPQALLKRLSRDAKNNMKNEVFEEACGILNSYSMLTINVDQETLSMHKLVQTIIMSTHNGPSIIHFFTTAADSTVFCTIREPTSAPEYHHNQQLLPHLQALQLNYEALQDDITSFILNPSIIFIYSAAGRICHENRSETLAVKYYKDAIRIQGKLAIPPNEGYWTLLHNLGLGLCSLGDKEGLKYLEDVIAHLKENIELLKASEDHKELMSLRDMLATTYNNLALFWSRIRECETAVGYYLKAIKIYKTVQPHNNLLNLAKTLRNLGDEYQRIKNYKEAAECLKEAHSLFKKHYGNHPEAANTTLSLISLLVISDEETYDLDTFISDCRIVIDNYKVAFGDLHHEVAKAFGMLSQLYYLKNDYCQARVYAERSVDIYKRNEDLSVKEKLSTIRVLCHLAIILYHLNVKELPRQYLSEAIQSFIDIYQSHLIDKLVTKEGIETFDQCIGIIYKLKDNHKVIEYLEIIIQIEREAYHENKDIVVSLLNHQLNQLGMIYRDLKQWDIAEKYISESYRILQECTNVEPICEIRYFNNMGIISFERGSIQQAEEYYHLALSKMDNAAQDNEDLYEEFARTFTNAGDLRRIAGRPNEAVAYLNRAVELTEKATKGRHTKTLVKRLNKLGELWVYLNNPKMALKYFENILDMEIKLKGERHKDVASTYNNIGLMLYYLKEYLRAKVNCENAVQIWHTYYPDHYYIASGYNNLGLANHALGLLPEAIDCFQSAIRIYDKEIIRSPQDRNKLYAELVKYLSNIAFAYKDSCMNRPALHSFIRSLNLQIQLPERDDLKISSRTENVGIAWLDLSENEKAIGCFCTAINIFQVRLGPFDENTLRVRRRLLALTHEQNKETIDRLWSMLRKYKLDKEEYLPTPEAALRRASAFGTTEDVKFLIRFVSDVDSQDANPRKLRTSLHWAFIEKKWANAEVLMTAGARTDIVDAENKTPKEYKPKPPM